MKNCQWKETRLLPKLIGIQFFSWCQSLIKNKSSTVHYVRRHLCTLNIIFPHLDKVHFWKRGVDNEVRCKCGKKRYQWLFKSIWVCWIQKWWIPKISFTSWPSNLHKNKMAAKTINLGGIVSRTPIKCLNLTVKRQVWCSLILVQHFPKICCILWPRNLH